jgi:hypothetical protein
MARLGYEVEIAALHPAWAAVRQRTSHVDGVTVSYVGQMHVRQEGDRRRYFSRSQLLWVSGLATIALARAALTRRVDVVHLAKPHPMNGLAGWLGARLRPMKLYLDCDDYEAVSNNFGSAWRRRWCSGGRIGSRKLCAGSPSTPPSCANGANVWACPVRESE